MSTSPSLALLAALVLLLLLVALPLRGAISFVEPLSLPLTTAGNCFEQGGIAVADFNGDGHADVATTQAPSSGRALSVLLGHGDGTFQAGWRYTGFTVTPFGITTGDFDRDGAVDVVVALRDGHALGYFRGLGDGTFEAPVSVTVSGYPLSVQASDLDGDSKLDLVATGQYLAPWQAEVLLGHGDGTFSAPTSHTVCGQPIDLALADVNGAGGPDILVACHDAHAVSVLLNDGHGGFPASGTNSEVRTGVRGVYVADFDADGKRDVVVAGDSNELRFAKGNGDGTFQTPLVSAYQPTLSQQTRAFSPNVTPDLNGDGKPDVVFYSVSPQNFATVGLGKGDGTFDLQALVASAQRTKPGGFAGEYGRFSAAFGDFDEDGLLDIAMNGTLTTDGQSQVSVLLGAPGGTFRTARAYALRPGASWTTDEANAVVGDFDGDGHPDVVAPDTGGRLNFLKGLGDGRLASGIQAGTNPSNEQAYAIKAAHFDSDGKLDVAFIGTNHYVVDFGNGDGTFGTTLILPAGAAVTLANLAVADLDGDGYQDLVALLNGRIDVYLNNQNRTFTLQPSPPTFTWDADQSRAFLASDLDGDGRADLLCFGSGSPNQLLFFKGKGDGSFLPPVASPGGPRLLVDLAAGELSGDGRKDLVAVSGYGNPATVWLGNGDGTFQSPASMTVGSGGSRAVALSDLDLDGRLDVAVAMGSFLEVLAGKGDGTFAPAVAFAVGQQGQFMVGAADLDTDGRPDLVVGTTSAIPFTVLMNDSGPRANLSIAKTQSPDPAEVGQLLTYTITVTNAGSDAASGVVVRDPLRTGSLFLGATPSQGSCALSTGLLTCSLGTIAGGSSASVTLNTMPTRIGALTNTASVRSSTADLNTVDDGSAAVQTVEGRVQLFGPGRITPGGTYDYLVRWINWKNVSASDAVLAVSLPATLSFVSASDGGVSYPERRQVFWRLGDLAPFARGTVSLTVRAVWGSPAHLVQGVSAALSAASWADAAFDVTEYFQYGERLVASTEDLTPSDVAAILASDAELNALYTQRMAEGYQDAGVASRTMLSTGAAVLNIWLVNPAVKRVASVTRDGDVRRVDTIGFDTLAISDAAGGIEWNASELLYRTYGDWALVHSPTMAQCMVNCTTDKLWGIWGTDLVPGLGTVLSVPACIQCLSGNGNCDGCLGILNKKWVNGVLSVNAAVQCQDDCYACVHSSNPDTDPRCHWCTPGAKFTTCGPAPWFMKWLYPYVNYTYECQVGGIWDKGTSLDFVNCRYDETLVCENGKLKCVKKCRPKKTGTQWGTLEPLALDPLCDPCCDAILAEAYVAGDPNAKDGPAGDVLPGETLHYTIHFENVGEGTAYGVYVTDELDARLDTATLSIQDGGYYVPGMRTVFWEVGDLAPGEGGTVRFYVNVAASAAPGVGIVNVANVVFPSVPSVTATNAVLSWVSEVGGVPLSLTTQEGVALPITLLGKGPAGHGLAFQVVEPPEAGTLAGAPPHVTYLPVMGYEGPDRFTFKVVDGGVESVPATVSILVTPSPLDHDPPVVLAVEPRDAERVAVFTDPLAEGAYKPVVKATFHEPLDPATVVPSAFSVRCGGVGLPGALSYDAASRSLKFVPSQPLAYGTTCAAAIGTGLRDSSGNALAAEYRWSFSTFANAVVNLAPSRADFGHVNSGATRTLAVEIVNTGQSNLAIGTNGVSGPDAAFFTVTSDPCSGQTLVPAGRCALAVRFAPTGAGIRQATLTVASSAGPATSSLVGNRTSGDANGDGALNVTDVLYLINHLFAGGPAPVGWADANADGAVNVMDILYLINHLFAGGPAPV